MMKRSKFDPVEGVMRKSSIMLLIVSVFIVFGIYSLINMPKNEFPTFTVRQGVVAAVYPGATSAEVEEQVTKPLEKFLWGFKEIHPNNGLYFAIF
jgi:multidrug efflux pump subunit AcrB